MDIGSKYSELPGMFLGKTEGDTIDTRFVDSIGCGCARAIKMRSVFLSHSSVDKPIVRRIGEKLKRAGIAVWIDEAEINVGDSLIDKISQAIERTDFVVAVISRQSVDSNWVQKELSLAMSKEILGKKVVVLPLLVQRCKVPFFLSDKLYADLTDDKAFDDQMAKVVRAINHWKPHDEERGTKEVALVAEKRVGTHVFGDGKPDEAFSSIRSMKIMDIDTRYSFFTAFILVLVAIGLLLVRIAGSAVPIPLMILPSIAGGFLLLSGTLKLACLDHLGNALYGDSNLLVELESKTGYVIPFGPAWIELYRVGLRNKEFCRAMILHALAAALKYVCAIVLIATMVWLVWDVFT